MKSQISLKKVNRVIQLNPDPWLKPYLDLTTKLIQKAGNNFEKYFFRLLNNAVFGTTMKNVRKHITHVTTERRRNYLV